MAAGRFGGRGAVQTTGAGAANALINELSTATAAPVDADYYISQSVGGGTTTTTYHRRPMSALWSYIKGKIGLDSNGILPVSNGGTGATNAAHANQNLFNSGEIANATGYPTVPGIWRTVGTNIFSNLTDAHSNYGVLIIFKAVYALHLYIDANGYFFWGYSGDAFREPANWYGINRLSNNCYGANLPSPGIPGRLFYKKV